MASATFSHTETSLREKSGNTKAFARPTFSEADFESTPCLEQLNSALSRLGTARQNLAEKADVAADADVADALTRVQASLDAVRNYSHNLERRLAKNGPNADSADRSSGKQRQTWIWPDANTDNKAETAQAQPNGDETTDSFCFQGKGLLQTFFDFGATLLAEPQIFLHHYQNFAVELLQIVQGKSTLVPERRDHRFRDGVWQDNVFYRAILQTYLAWSRHLEKLIDELPFADEDDRRRGQFVASQVVAACSPSNSLFNPAVIKRSFQTGGLSLVSGMQNFLRDLATNHGMPRQVNPNAYQVGKDLAVSEGAVILRTEVLELIQYRCIGEHVSERPILIVPPQINKFYIFDLTPKNSIVRHLLRSGHQVFIVSWKNPNAANSAWNLATYVKHLCRAMEASAAICQSSAVNLASGCAGGLTATALQAYCHQLRENGTSKYAPRINSHSLLVTALSAKQHPILNLFVNKDLISLVLSRAAGKGVMDGRELSHVFSWLRPVDLVWNFWVNNILLGKKPPTMDVLYWDNDSTHLPAGLHRDFIDIVVNDRFTKAEGIVIDNEPVNLEQIGGDFYFVGGEEDYLMPWQNCYRNIELLPKANCRFLLSNSGHIQSILRPPGIANIYYYTNDEQPQDPEQWLQDSSKHEGSWWDDWTDWLAQRGGNKKPAPAELGNRDYPPLCPSPGTYVLEK